MSQMVLVKQGEFVRFYEDGRVLIRSGILSYPHLDRKWSKVDPKTGIKPPEKFSAKHLLDKEMHAETYEMLSEHIRELVKDAKVNVGRKDWFLRDGDDSGKPEEADRWTINASELRNVILRDKDANPIRNARGELLVDDASEILEIFKPGYIVDMLIRPWVQDNAYGRKVNANLLAVKLVDDTTEVLGGGSLDDDGVWGEGEGGGSTRSNVRGKQNTKRTALDDDDDDEM